MHLQTKTVAHRIGFCSISIPNHALLVWPLCVIFTTILFGASRLMQAAMKAGQTEGNMESAQGPNLSDSGDIRKCEECHKTTEDIHTLSNPPSVDNTFKETNQLI